MKLQFWSVGKVHESYVKEGIEIFSQRISHYFPVEWKLIPSPKTSQNLAVSQLQKEEAAIISKHLKDDDVLVLLDERGKQITSEQLGIYIQQQGNASVKNLVFLIGGAYGVDESIARRANFKWSLSSLIFRINWYGLYFLNRCTAHAPSSAMKNIIILS